VAGVQGKFVIKAEVRVRVRVKVDPVKK